MRIAKIIAAIGLLALAGCAAVEKQAFNRAANTSVRSITILEPAPSTGFGVNVMNHPGLGFGLIGASIYAAEMKSKSETLDAALRHLNWTLSDELSSAVAAELAKVGYTVKRHKVKRDGFATITNYGSLISERQSNDTLATDAWLDLATRDPLYVANGPTADYVPSIGVTARLVSSKDQSLLYRDDLFFGFSFNAPRLEAVVIPAGDAYRFPRMDDLTADPPKTLEGLKQGVPLLARRIASDLARDSGGGAATALR